MWITKYLTLHLVCITLLQHYLAIFDLKYIFDYLIKSVSFSISLIPLGVGSS